MCAKSQSVVRSRQRHSLFHVIAGVFAMCDAIRRMFVLLFGRPQPIDFWLLGADIAIVALIIWLDVPEKLHKRRISKCIASLLPFMERGQELQRITPRPAHDTAYNDAAWEWKIFVDDWRKEVEKFLEQSSPRAASVFGFIVQTGIRENPQVVYTESDSFAIEGFHRDSYQKLIAELNNLRSIMEKPEAYF